MPYLNLDVDFFTHRKTLRLIGLLGDVAIPCLLRLWAYAAKHHVENGTLTGLTACELESIVGWRGEPGVLMLTLTNLGFVDIISNNCRIHGWKEHAGHLIVFKRRAKAAACKRWEKYASSMPQALLTDESSTAKLQITNAPNLSYPSHTKPTKPIKTKPREGKRPWPDDLVLSEELIELGKQLGLDASFQFDKARNYCKANGKRYADYHAFLRNWFQNAVNDKRYAVKGIVPITSYEGAYHKKVVL